MRKISKNGVVNLTLIYEKKQFDTFLDIQPNYITRKFGQLCLKRYKHLFSEEKIYKYNKFHYRRLTLNSAWKTKKPPDYVSPKTLKNRKKRARRKARELQAKCIK